MPTYAYRCSQGHEVERFFSMVEKPKTVKCPTCGKRAKAQIGAGGGAVFQGSFPGQDLRRDTYNETMIEKAKRARKMKLFGLVPTEERIRPRDIDLSKPDRLPSPRLPCRQGPKPTSGPGS
jgi:putative FmdB family regulatory protein